MTDQRKAIISLMPARQTRAVDEWRIVEDVLVDFSSDPKDGDVYKLPNKVKIGEQWVDMFTFAKKGLSSLCIAGGIKEIDSKAWQVKERVWQAKWLGEYTTPAGITIPLGDEYEFDCRIGGTRWDERKASAIAGIVKKKSKAYRLDSEGVAKVWSELDKEKQEEIEMLAEAVATRYVIQAAQYGLQRAMTGARDRALRVFFQIGQYTKEQIDNSAFLIQRTQADYSRMPEGIRNALLMADIMTSKGIPAELQSNLIKMIGLPQSEVVDTDTKTDDEVIDAESTPIESPFEQPANKDLVSKVRQLIAKVFGKVVSTEVFDNFTQALFEQGFAKLSQGQMRLAEQYLDKIKLLKDQKVPNKEIKETQAHLKVVVAKCNKERRLMIETDYTQLTLPEEAKDDTDTAS